MLAKFPHGRLRLTAVVLFALAISVSGWLSHGSASSDRSAKPNHSPATGTTSSPTSPANHQANDRNSLDTSNLFGVAGPADLNQAGDYSFIGNGSSALFLRPASSGAILRVIQSGDSVPGIPGSRAATISGAPRLNSSGKLAFLQFLNTTNGLVETAILTYEAGGGGKIVSSHDVEGVGLQKIVSSSDVAPGTGGAIFGQNILFAGMNDAGDIAFTGSLTPLGSPAGTPAQTTLFIVPSGSAPVRVAGPGDAAPATGGTFNNITLASGNNSLNNAGEVLFRAQVVGGGGGFGLFAGSTAGVRKIVANGDPIPGGGTFSFTSAPAASSNNAGQVVFSAANTLWVHTSGTGLAKAVALGDAAPAAIGGTFSTSPSLHAVNDSGVIAFNAGVTGSSVTTAGLFRYRPGNPIENVLYVGQAAPGAAPAIFAGLSGLASMNNSGLISFQATLSGGSSARGIYQQSGTSAAVKILLEGQATPLAGGGTFNLISSGFTRTFSSGSTYFWADVLGGAATYAEFLGSSSGFSVLMNDADPLPSGSRTSLQNFQVGAGGDYIAFVAQQAGGRYSLIARNINTGVTTTIGMAGDVAPGTSGGRFRAQTGSIFVNSSGTLAFNSQIIGGTQVISNGVFMWTQSGGLTKVVATGDLDPNSGSTFSGPTVNSFSPSPLNEAGQVAFRAIVLGKSGIYVRSVGGAIQRIAQNGDAAPGGGTFSSFSAQAINQSGQVAFFASTIGGPAQNQGVFVGTPGGGVIKIASSGDSAPGGSTFFSFPASVSFNDSGEVAFIASLGTGTTGGAFIGSSLGSLQALARDGAASPAGGTFSITRTAVDILTNNQHDVAFRSALTGGSADSAYFLRRGASGPLQAVARQGQSTPGTPGAFSSITQSLNAILGEFFALGPTGELAFQTAFQTGAGPLFGTFRYRTDNLLEKIVARGDILPGTGNGVLMTGSQILGTGGPGHFAFWAAVLGGNVADLIYVTNSPAGFGISGQVKDVSGNGINGVTMTLSGSVSGTTTTDNSGNYSFATLTNGGNYTVTPSSANFSFSPASETFNDLTIDRIANFVGTQTTVSISGKVTDSNNAGLGNVTLALTKNGLAAGTTSSDGSGNYSFNNVTAGANYVVTPAGSFTPASQTLNNLTANATANFKAAPSIPPQCNTTSFAAATNFAAGSSPFGIALGDFNGDGKVDLAVPNFDSNNVSILLGTGTGSFGAPTNFAVGSGPLALAAGDFNGDGKLDLAVVNNSSNNVSLLLGTGTGSFGSAANVTVGQSPRAPAVGDFNGDGKSDLAVATVNVSGPSNVAILLGTSGNFSAPTNFAVAGSFPQSVAVSDFNGDGKRDLAVANGNAGNVSILLGTGTGSFSAATNFIAGTNPQSIAVGDFNGDGRIDLAVTNFNSATVSIVLGTGTGSFGAATTFAVGSQPLHIVAGDFNGDGKLDLATANQSSNNISILPGTGTGSFGAATNFAVSSSSFSLAASDFNSDGKLDLTMSNFTANNVGVLLNNGTSCNSQTSVTISGRITSANNTSLADVTVTLSGPITRVVQTDISGNYSFPNLVPGGNYSVTLQSSYFVFAPSRTDFFNLSSSQVADFIAAPLAVPSPTPTPNDDFTSTVRDASKWSIGAQTSSTTAFDPQVTTAQTNGQLVITPLTQASGLHFAGYVSANSFDLRNGSAKVEVVKAATGGADTIFAVGTDADNFYRFMVHTTGTTTSLAPRAKGRDGIERPLDTTVAQLVFQVNVGGQLTSLSIDYNPTLHRFMRFRHVPPANSIVFETSPDNVDFTVQHTVVLQKSVSALTAELSAGTSNPTNPGQTVFDNFGLVTSTFQFSAGSYSVGEGDGSILATVTRAGSLADTASVDFATADGTARQKSRYTSAAGTLSFASGIASRTFRVLLVDNQLAEGEQTLNLLLSNPIGSGLNTPGRAVLTIVDNDSTLATTNSLDDARYFVTQHYYDFLSRVPDQGGLDFWVSQITLCGTDEACLRTQRITVSNAFFYEQEYQQTGSYVVRVYRAAYGNNQPIPNNDANPQFPNENKKLVNYSAFSPDRARVRGGPSLAQTQLDLANAFVLRPQFMARYPATLDGPAFVDAMLATINTDIGVNLTSQRTALIDLFNQGGRGQVLYRLADDNANNPIANQAFLDAEYNRAFVLTQYFGYLRRNPDVGGFVFWLGQVNSAPLRSLVKQRAMVCSFITSLEYQQRFSPVATHNNTECPQ